MAWCYCSGHITVWATAIDIHQKLSCKREKKKRVLETAMIGKQLRIWLEKNQCSARYLGMQRPWNDNTYPSVYWSERISSSSHCSLLSNNNRTITVPQWALCYPVLKILDIFQIIIPNIRDSVATNLITSNVDLQLYQQLFIFKM